MSVYGFFCAVAIVVLCVCSRSKTKNLFYQIIDKRGFFVIQLGLEPRTPSLKGMCSTCWATRSDFLKAVAKIGLFFKTTNQCAHYYCFICFLFCYLFDYVYIVLKITFEFMLLRGLKSVWIIEQNKYYVPFLHIKIR